MAEPAHPLAFLLDRERFVQRFLLSEILGPPAARRTRAPPARPPDPGAQVDRAPERPAR